jgi:type III pantothenate kinase
VVSEQGDYLGGVICPGPRISADALFTRAARLARVDFARPERVVGKTTTQSMQSGLFWGVVAQTEGIVARIRAEMESPQMKVVVTGGLAPLFAAASPELAHVDPDLTLKGLRLLHERNRKP